MIFQGGGGSATPALPLDPPMILLFVCKVFGLSVLLCLFLLLSLVVFSFSLIVRALRDKNRSHAICVPIYGDLYQNLQWSLTFNLKVVTYLKSASEASNDVINMATIIRNCPLIKAIVCVGMVIFIQHERFFKHNINYFSHMMITSMLYVPLTMNYLSITIFGMQNTVDFL